MSTTTINPPTAADDAEFSQGLAATDWHSDLENDESGSFFNDRSVTAVHRGRTIRKFEVAEVTAQLAIMIKSGVDIGTALSSLASQSQRPALAEILADVRESVMAGNSFSHALTFHPDVFDPAFVATVAAGEASGRMSEVLQQLSRMQKNAIRRSREIRSLLTYPVLLLLVSGSVLSALMLFVLPRFTQIFAQYDMPLPVITQFFLAIAAELRSRWWLWGPAVVSLVMGLLIWRKTELGRYSLDRFWLRGPLVGDICRCMCVGKTCRLLGLMLDNGVPLLESLQLTRRALTNRLYKEMLLELEDAVVNGQGLAAVLQETAIVPPSAKEMLVTAESTGKLNEVTGLLGDHYEEESEAKLRQLVGLMEPIITVVMGGIVAVVVLAVMLPVFNLSTFAGGH